jgi:hypothetical protein
MTHSSFITIAATDTRRRPRAAAHLPTVVAALALLGSAIAWHAIFGVAFSALR